MNLKLFLFLVVFGIPVLHGQTTSVNIDKGYAAKGYDVVAYFDYQAVKGHKTYSTVYNGVMYKFSSETNLDTFNANPENYLPQYGGYCAYAIAVNSKKVDINPKTFEIRDGKLYLFYNSWGKNTLKLWQKNNVKGLQNKADKNWEAMTLK